MVWKLFQEPLDDAPTWTPPPHDLHARTSSFFRIPGAIKFSGSEIKRRQQVFEKTLENATNRYSNGQLSLQEYQDILTNEVEPLRQSYETARDSPGNPLW